ncbi:hypothetical protein HNQ56_004104 [Anaerotaenia torta]
MDVERGIKPFYRSWNGEEYRKYLTRFELDPKKNFKDFSRGMKMKLAMAFHLSHEAKLLLLDEPTGGLDPVARDEILDIMREYMVKDDRTILFSTHITSDLERIADMIIYIRLTVGTIATIFLSSLLYGRKILIFEPHTFNADFNTILLIICCSLLLYAIMNLSMFPILFKIGYAKGKALGFYIPIITASIVVFILIMVWSFNSAFQTWLISAIEWSFANTVWVTLIILAAAAFLLAISYLLSRKVYAKRDF